MGEVLLTVGILCILIAVSFPAIGYFSRLLNQTKLDNMAKEIFISAQNKLVTMKACGMEMPTGNTMGMEPPTDYDKDAMGEWPNQGSEIDPFVFVSSDDTDFTFMDDTPIGKDYQEGKYIIEFNRSTGDVYGVFYWEPQELDFGGSSSFVYASHYNTYTNGEKTYQLRDEKKQRMDSGLKVGYYGGNGTQAMADAKEFEFNAELTNAEKLQLKLTPENHTVGMDTRYVVTLQSATDTTNPKEYTIGLQYVNGAPHSVTIDADGKGTIGGLDAVNIEKLNTEYGFLITLDSVEAGQHFANLFPEIVAGDDISIKVQAYYLGSKEIYVAKSNYETIQNTLFADVRQDGGLANPKGKDVAVATGRHLQNLSKEASHLGYTTNENEALETKTNYPIVNTKLLNDINWQDAAYNYNEKNTLYSASMSLNSFQPICNYDTGLRVFDGNGWTISNLYVTKYTDKTNTDNIRMGAGLFGVVYNDTTIKDFTMQDCYVESTSAAVGTVVGTFASREAASTKSYLQDIEVIDCTVKMTRNAHSGMLTGYVTLTNNDGTDLASIQHGVYIQNCGVYLSDENSDAYYQEFKTADINHAVTNQNGNAGGLVGYLDKGCLVIQDSFSAVNVYAGANAGGLVGATNDKLYINNSYSSCMVDSEGESGVGAGGLVGKYTKGWIKAENCFTTCDVSANCYSGGAFGHLIKPSQPYSSASIQVKNVQSYGTVSWKGGICADEKNMTIGESFSGGFIGRIEKGLLEWGNTKNNFYIESCQYLSMKGYNNSNPGDNSNAIKGYGCDYKNLSLYPNVKIDIKPSLYEESDKVDGEILPFMPQMNLPVDRQKMLTHAYSNDLQGYPYPFRLLTYKDHASEYIPYHGNWPKKGEIETALVYYEKYVKFKENTTVEESELYGYYAVTTIGEGQSAWTLDTLKTQEWLDGNSYSLVEDGYALLSTYQLKEFTYTLNGDMGDAVEKTGTIKISDDEPSMESNKADGKAQRIGGAMQELVLEQEGAEKLTVHAEIYKFPFFLQDISKNRTLEFYDKLEISYTADHKYDENGVLQELVDLVEKLKDAGKEPPANWNPMEGNKYVVNDNYTFYYCCHFGKTAINPYVGRMAARRPARAHEVYVRSARHLNAIGRYPYYWNSNNNEKWKKYAFQQELDLNFSTYTTRYCGENSFFMNPQDWDEASKSFTRGYERNVYENRVIGRTGEIEYQDPNTGEWIKYFNFQNDYDGGGYQIINFKLYAEGLYYVGLFGEVYGSTLENIHLTTDDELARLFEGEKYNETYGGSYLVAAYTYQKLQYINPDWNDDNGIAHNYGLGALVGKVYCGTGASANAVIIKNCSVSGYSVIGKMDPTEKVGEHIVNQFPRTARNYGFHVGGFVGFNNGYIVNCTAENKLVQFEYAHPHNNSSYGREKTLGGFAGSNQGVIVSSYAGGKLEITVNEDERERLDTAKSEFYIGGFAGTNCYAGFAYESGNTAYPDGTKGVLLKDCYSFCSITKDETSNQYVPAENIYGVTWTTDTAPIANDYENSINKWHGSSFNATAENVANCYYLAELVQLNENGEDKRPMDEAWVVGIEGEHCGITADTMRDIPAFSTLLNQSMTGESYAVRQNGTTVTVLLKNFAETSLTAEKSYPYSRSLQGKSYVFPAVVQNHAGEYVHFGDWPNVLEKVLGLCYYEKYGDGDYGLFIRGINADLYTKDGALDTYLSYVDTLEYDTASTKRVQASGYCIAATTRVEGSKLSGYTPLAEPLVMENYQFYELPTTGITKDANTGICSMNLPGYDVAASYHPDFGAAIKFGDLTQDANNLTYASDLPVYQVRNRTQMENISSLDSGGWPLYSQYTFHQTMNIDTGLIEGDALIASMPYNTILDGKGSHYDSETKVSVPAAASYTITMTLKNSVAGSGIKNVGLIGSNMGMLQNLVLDGSAECTYHLFTGGFNFGVLVGWNLGGTVENCISKVNMTLKGESSDSILKDSYIGGLIGINQGVCRSSYVDCTILGADSVVKSNGTINIGGLAGSSPNVIEDCQVNGSIASGTTLAVRNNDLAIGGLAGEAGTNIARSFVFASIGEGAAIEEYKNLAVGGFLGNIKSENVTAEASGFAGNIRISITGNKVWIGQFVGLTNNHDTFISCYGWETENSRPFSGDDKPNTVYNGCYYYGTDSGKTGLIPTTDINAVLSGLQAPEGWQWQMDTEKGVPILTKITVP